MACRRRRSAALPHPPHSMRAYLALCRGKPVLHGARSALFWLEAKALARVLLPSLQLLNCLRLSAC
jgi:hypothetical protein